MKIFNIQEEHVKTLYKQRISLDCLYFLEKLLLEEDFEEDVKTASFLQTLERKGYINSVQGVTEAGRELYTQLFNKKKIKVPKLAIDREGLNGIHKKLEDKILELTGSKQYRPSINGVEKSFLCNETDLLNKLVKVINKYKITDFEKMEKTLIRYIENCNKSKFWFPLITYYIHKRFEDGTEASQLVTDMENIDKKIKKTEHKSIDI